MGAVEKGKRRSAYIITRLTIFPRNIMEAEQINQIVHRLADIGQRAAELRRYL
jgi:hypothetical protein